MSINSYIQFVLPLIGCGSPHGKKLTIEVRIQRSRRSRIDNLVGLYDATRTYSATFDGSGNQTLGDVVYSNSAYPGWRYINTTPSYGNAPPASMAAWQALLPSGSAHWEPASNFEFAQAYLGAVFYLDQQILTNDGIGQLQRTVSRQQGLINPDARSLKFLDYTTYSGIDGLGTVVGRTDLSATNYRTLLGAIFSDPLATYTIFISRVTGTGYSTNRELYSIGDLDYAKTTALYHLDFDPGQTGALQKLAVRGAADSVVNRLSSFNVRDLILSIAVSDVSGPYPFIGGQVLLGGSPPPMFPQFGNRFPLSGYIIGNDFPYLSLMRLGSLYNGRPVYNNSRANSCAGGVHDTTFGTAGDLVKQNILILATSSINDGLHFISLETLLTKIFALVNFTWQSSDLQTLLTFWADTAGGAVSSANVPLANIGFCYEWLFNIDPRCYFGIAGQGTGAEMSMSSGFKWSQNLADVVRRIAIALITYIKSTYDQTNYRAENQFADAINPTSVALPSNWKQAKGAGIKPRILTARHVEVHYAGDSDIYACPTVSGDALSLELGFRVRKLGLLNASQGDSTIDLMFNSKLAPGDQSSCFQPFTGGIIDGGHIVSTCTTASSSLPSGLPSGNGGAGSTGYGLMLTLEDAAREFVLVQGAHGNLWDAQNDIYANFTNYLNGNCPSYGNSDSVCFANGSYAAIVDKINRNRLYIMYPHALPTGIPGGPAPPTNGASDLPYVIGYSAFGLDGIVCSDSTGTEAATGATGKYFKSGNIDFYNFDCFGNGMIGQTIVIPNRGIYTILNIYSSGNRTQPFNSVIELSGQVHAGSSLEFRVGGPQPNPDSFILGSYFYRINTSAPVFGTSYNIADQTGVNPLGFFPSFYLGADPDSTSTGTGWHGCYPLSRMVYTGTISSIDGSVYSATGAAPDDSFGTGLKTFAMTQAALNLSSYQNVSRGFIGVLSDAGTMLGYGPLDTYSEWSQGQQQSYKAQSLIVDEFHGTVQAELISTVDTPPLDDVHFPIFDIGGESSGGGGGGNSGGGGGGNGSGSSPLSSSMTWAANTGSIALTVGVNLDVPVSGITEMILTAISGASSVSGFFDNTLRARAGLTVINQTGYSVTFKNLDSGSLATGQIVTGTGTDFIVPNSGSATFVYAPVDGYWHLIGAWSGSTAWQPTGPFTLTGTGVIAITNTDSAIIATASTITGVTAPTVQAPQTLVITNKTGADWTAGNFQVPNNGSWLLYYDGTATQSDLTLPAGWNIIGRSS